ncbi:DUF421 domain-containing protein [Amycolatopsis tolypomycina]|uniref:DUF421 domain-containing protein n=1 Tax=Amycolatopsis tolypomycina TaxID=208445 RepID=UPI0033B27FC5
MTWFFSGWGPVAEACGKTALLVVTALAALRIAPRRTLAELRIFDFAVAVAVGAIIGRTATASGTSFMVGFGALVTLLALHTIIGRLRFSRRLRRLLDHPVRTLVTDGQVDRAAMRAAHLTDDDLDSALRQQGVDSLREVESVLYETQGAFTVRRRDRTKEER